MFHHLVIFKIDGVTAPWGTLVSQFSFKGGTLTSNLILNALIYVQDKLAIVQKISQNIVQAWHKVKQGKYSFVNRTSNDTSLYYIVTKDLPTPLTTEDSETVDTTTPWSQYDQV